MQNVDQTLAEFRAEIIGEVYRGHYTCLDDNFDHFRYGFEANPRFIHYETNARYLDYLLENLESFYASSLLFSDADSRHLFLQLIKYRCLGAPHFRIQEDMTWASIQSMFERASQYERGPSRIDFEGMFGRLQHYEGVPADNGFLTLDTWRISLAYALGPISGSHRQYFFNRSGVAIRPETGDFVVDGGACLGETGVFFASQVGPSGMVYSFDPLPTHVNVVEFNITQNGFGDRMRVVPMGLSDRTNAVEHVDQSLIHTASPGFSLLSSGADSVPTISIDDFVKREKPQSIDFIKLDIEGYEMAALLGAADSIARFRPKLAISLYHTPADFFTIPIHLKQHYPFYRLYLDHHTIFHEETVLYAVA